MKRLLSIFSGNVQGFTLFLYRIFHGLLNYLFSSRCSILSIFRCFIICIDVGQGNYSGCFFHSITYGKFCVPPRFLFCSVLTLEHYSFAEVKPKESFLQWKCQCIQPFAIKLLCNTSKILTKLKYLRKIFIRGQNR